VESKKEKMTMRTTVKRILTLTLAAPLMLTPIARVRVFGQHDDGSQDLKLQGVWDVTLRFPVCNATCTCPGGVPNIPIPSLNTFQKDNTLQVALGGSLFAGPGQGSWERLGYNHFKARFKFFVFNASGIRVASEEVTKSINFTSPDAFQSSSTYDFFNAAGTLTAQSCPINETATRFE